MGAGLVSTFRDAAAVVSVASVDHEAGATAQRALEQAAKVVRTNVVRELGRHKRTGGTARRVKVTSSGAGLDFAPRVAAGGAANLIVEGVKPHAIPRGDALSNAPMPVGGGRYARTVNHPGMRADPVFERGVAASAAAIERIVKVAAERMARELAHDISRRR